MINFSQSLTHFLKETNGKQKVGFLMGLYLIYMFFTYLFEVFSVLSEKDGYEFLILFMCITGLIYFVAAIAYSIFGTLYQYEYIQAAIMGRETNFVWSYSPMDSFKRFGKLLILGLIYGLPIMAIGFVVAIIDVLLIVLLLPVGIIFTILSVIAFVPLVVIYQMLVMAPGQLRMIATDTFSEGLQVQHNWHIGKKYWKELFTIFVYIFAVSLVFGFGAGFLGAIQGIWPESIVGPILVGLYMMSIGTVMTYFTTFPYSHMLGNLYRQILEKEGMTGLVKR